MMTAAERKEHPLYSGVLKYFPDALMAVAHLSKIGNDQHNPGQPLHWAKEKSTDHGDCIMRHLKDAGTLDADGERHSAKVAWRALALLQTEIDNEKKIAAVQALAARADDDLHADMAQLGIHHKGEKSPSVPEGLVGLVSEWPPKWTQQTVTEEPPVSYPALPVDPQTPASIYPLGQVGSAALGCCSASRKVLSECHCESSLYKPSPCVFGCGQLIRLGDFGSYYNVSDGKKHFPCPPTTTSPQADGDNR